jgi:ABC-2 type transport system ATP-binding protein
MKFVYSGTTHMIKAVSLTKRFNSIQALDGISFEIAPGELFACLGPNGAGKTTTIRIFTGVSRPTSGLATVAGEDLSRHPEARKHVGVVAQTINLDGELTVAQNLDIHGRLFAMDSGRRRKRITDVLDELVLSDRAGSQVKTLSGGLKRRVMIARALMHQPDALFLDEPTVGLDADIRRSLWSLIKQVKSQGAALFLTTHYIEEAEVLADRVAFLKNGRITAMDKPQNLIESVGAWANVDLSGKAPTTFFADRSQAMRHAADQNGDITVRRTSLEDAYLASMGTDNLASSHSTGMKGGHGKLNGHGGHA